MPITEVPNRPPPPKTDGGTSAEQTPESGLGLLPRPGSGDYIDLGTDGLVQRISELEDERRAARIREGIWVALLLHAAFLLLWAFGPRYLFHQPRVVSPAEALKDRKDLTYLDLPPDALKQLKPKNPAAISDKDRQQSTAHPTLDKKTLEQLQAMRRAGPPTPQPPAQQQQAPTPQQAAPQQQQPAPQQQAQQQPPPQPSQLQSEARPQSSEQSQSKTNPFKTPSSAGDMIRQAAKGASSGSSGDFGAGAPAMHGGMNAGAEILSDTLGVDFGPYMKRVIAATYSAWLPIIPESARPPLDNKGKVYIDFIIAPDGSVKKMLLRGPSGDVALDRAAWGGITGASYPPLPKEFKGPYLALRFGFYYNIKPEDDR
jgi:outer membrane biosynthesis protein TonB